MAERCPMHAEFRSAVEGSSCLPQSAKSCKVDCPNGGALIAQLVPLLISRQSRLDTPISPYSRARTTIPVQAETGKFKLRGGESQGRLLTWDNLRLCHIPYPERAPDHDFPASAYVPMHARPLLYSAKISRFGSLFIPSVYPLAIFIIRTRATPGTPTIAKFKLTRSSTPNANFRVTRKTHLRRVFPASARPASHGFGPALSGFGFIKSHQAMAFTRGLRVISGFGLRNCQAKSQRRPQFWLGFGLGTKTKKPQLFGLRPRPEKR
ncbi:hypothetical protein B0H13DRAFT_1891052 [Mycena leptocephala]|nr:hypothetical protein B0H13DRAFT_1891052 [Mycena leptocephala]